MQYSVFTAQLTQRKLLRVMEGLDRIIEPRADDVRIYPLPTRTDARLLGRQMFPDDVLLLDGGINLIIR